MPTMRVSRSTAFVVTLIAASTAFACTAAACAADAASAGTTPIEPRATAIAAGIAHITGLAISPLLVLVAVGWSDFARLGGLDAAQLPLHASPWVLIPCSLVLALALLKKVASPAIPLPIRKLLDAAEYLQAKLSALVAAGLLLPTIVASMAAAAGTGDDATVQAAGFTGGWLLYAWLVPAVLAVFFAVWVTFHVIDALVVLSPFALLDALLVSLRASVLIVLALALAISPMLALVFCVPIVLLSFVISGWCVRLDLFALCVAGDLLFARQRKVRPGVGAFRGFLAARGLGAPIRTMGHAEPCEGGVRFAYHPLFVLPKRTLLIPAESPAVVRGVVWPTLIDDGTRRALVSLAPRYRGHEAVVAARFSAQLRDGLLRRSWKTLRDAFESLLAGGSATTVE